MKTIAIEVPDDLLAAIQSAAKKRGETKSAVMREALQEFLSKNQNTGSCLDLAVILPGVCKAHRIFQRIRPTWIITGNETGRSSWILVRWSPFSIHGTSTTIGPRLNGRKFQPPFLDLRSSRVRGLLCSQGIEQRH